MKSILSKIIQILSPRQKRVYLVLILLTLFGMAMESLGLGVLIPAISLIIQTDFFDILVSDYGVTFLSDLSYKNGVVFVLFLLGFIYLIKTIFLTYLLDKQNKFVFGLHAYFSKTLYTKYLNQSHAFFLQTNTSEVIKNIMVEVKLLSKYFISLMHLFNEGLLLITVFCTLVFIEPIGIISIGFLFSIFGYLFFKVTNKRVNIYGQKRKEYDATISKLILEGYGGSKEIKLLGRNSFFTDQFNRLNDQKKIVTANQSTLAQLPRLYIELLAVLCVFGLVGIMLLQEQQTAEIISKVGVFVVAIFRIIPSYSKISASLQNVKYNKFALDVIHKKLQELDVTVPKDQKSIEFSKAIQLESISFKYATSEEDVLKNINLEIKKGETIGFIGVSGSGKSTLIDLLNGLLTPSKGVIKIDGIPLEKCLKSWQQKIGYVPQQNYLTDSSIAANIAFGLPKDQIDQKKLMNAINMAQLYPLIKTLPEGLNTTIGERGLQISGGQMQRIGIARALYNNPEVLIFDEATSALDESTEKSVLTSISELKKTKTIIVITHRKNALKDCDKVFKLNRGELEEFNAKISSEI